MQRRSDSPGNPVHGIGIFGNLPFKESVLYYAGSPESIPESSQDAALQADPSNKALLCAEFAEPSPFFIITTHFTWSPRGEATDEQRADMRAMLPLLQQQKEFVFCGDFNAPRGGEIWQMLASNYRDNIPPEYKTSLDLELHRAGKTHPEQLATKMVDGLFTTPGFVASNVRLQFGISDHAAIVATIARA